MKKVIRLSESDLIKIVKRVINEEGESDFVTYKKGITDLITSNGFSQVAGYKEGTYEKNLGERGIVYLIVKQYESNPYVLFFFRKPSEDILKLFPSLKPTQSDPELYTDDEGRINRGYDYYHAKSLEDTVAYKQINNTILPKIK